MAAENRPPLSQASPPFVGCSICLPAVCPQWLFWLCYWNLLPAVICLFQPRHCRFSTFLLALCLTRVISVVPFGVYPYKQLHLYNRGLWADKSSWGTEVNCWCQHVFVIRSWITENFLQAQSCVKQGFLQLLRTLKIHIHLRSPIHLKTSKTRIKTKYFKNMGNM